jgi:hypothetical protein
MKPQQGPARVDPGLIFAISLIGALVISWPGFSGAMQGSADVVTVGVRFLIAVAVLWTGLWIVTSLIAGFAAASERPANHPDDNGPTVAGTPALASAPGGGDPSLSAALEAGAAAAIAAETEHVAG